MVGGGRRRYVDKVSFFRPKSCDTIKAKPSRDRSKTGVSHMGGGLSDTPFWSNSFYLTRSTANPCPMKFHNRMLATMFYRDYDKIMHASQFAIKCVIIIFDNWSKCRISIRNGKRVRKSNICLAYFWLFRF